MIIEIMWLLIMAVCGVFLIELRANYRINHLVNARVELLGLQPYNKPQKQAFGTKH